MNQALAAIPSLHTLTRTLTCSHAAYRVRAGRSTLSLTLTLTSLSREGRPLGAVSAPLLLSHFMVLGLGLALGLGLGLGLR